MVLASILFAASSALAQPSLTQPQPDVAVVVHKDPGTATKLSVIGTLAGVGMMYFAGKFGDEEGLVLKGFAATFMITGPAWGAWWARDRPVFTVGEGLRAAAFAVGGIGYSTDTKCNAVARMTGGGEQPCTGSTSEKASDTMLGLGLALGLAGTVYDIIDAGHQARDRRFVVVPALTPSGGGVSAALSF